MKTIKILGTGCPKCKQTTAIVEQVVQEMKADVAIAKVEDIMEIMKFNVLNTPAVVLDEVVRIKGRVPSAAEIREVLASA